MINWVKEHQPSEVMMITECSMADNVAESTPHTKYVRPCNLCPHMKRITLANIRESLEKMQYQVEVPEDIAERARRAVSKMLEVGRQD
jgi:quinolinate synthase